MAPMRVIGCLAAAVAVAAACSSSTSPSDPFSGNWSVTFTSAPTGTQVIPSPWTLTIAKSGAGYTATYSHLGWASTTSNAALDTWSETNASTFAIQNDSLYLLAQDALKTACYFSLKGAFIATTASGSASAFGTSCTAGSFTWSAKKQ